MADCQMGKVEKDKRLVTLEDIKYAQQMAKLSNRKRKSDDFTKKEIKCDKVETESEHGKICLEDGKIESKMVEREINKITKVNNHWLRDKIQRLIVKITNLMHLLKRISNEKSRRNFRATLEIDTMNKRWLEFMQHAQHSLFIINREATKLSHSFAEKNTQQGCKSLHSLLHSTFLLLKGLEGFPEVIKRECSGESVLNDAMAVSQRVLLVCTLNGIDTFAKDINLNENLNSIADGSIEATSCDESTIEIDTTDMSGDALSILDPKMVRNKLVQLAYTRNGKKKELQIIKPRKKRSSSANKGHNLHRGEEEVYVVQDSLSQKLKKTQSSFADSVRMGPVKIRQSDDSTYNRDYGSPEKVADIILDKLLTRAQTAPISPSHNSTSSTYNENNIDDLSARISKLSMSVDYTDQFLLKLKNKLSQRGIGQCELDIDAAIKKANCLIDSFKQVPNSNFDTTDFPINLNGSSINGKTPTMVKNHSNFSNVENILNERRKEFWEGLVQNNFMQHLQAKECENKYAQTDLKKSDSIESYSEEAPVYTSSFERESDIKYSESIHTSQFSSATNSNS